MVPAEPAAAFPVSVSIGCNFSHSSTLWPCCRNFERSTRASPSTELVSGDGENKEDTSQDNNMLMLEYPVQMNDLRTIPT